MKYNLICCEKVVRKVENLLATSQSEKVVVMLFVINDRASIDFAALENRSTRSPNAIVLILPASFWGGFVKFNVVYVELFLGLKENAMSLHGIHTDTDSDSLMSMYIITVT